MCQNFILTHAYKLTRVAQGACSKHYTSIVATDPLETIQTYSNQCEPTPIETLRDGVVEKHLVSSSASQELARPQPMFKIEALI